MSPTKKQMRQRRKFTSEFKAEAVRIVRTSGKSVPAVARDLDLTETCLRTWVRRGPGGFCTVLQAAWIE